ncbi:MAG TPA: hypothetical protein VFS37_02630 [Conexibacter sp.]|nr:hypothetical protein [Conexibacter sp.]
MRRLSRLALAVALILLSGSAPSAGRSFRAHVDNPWYPLRPGTTYVYRGMKDGKPARDVVAVTHRTRVVGGVRCRVVHDRLFLRGRLAERTSDYFAQDAHGTVWYFGEDTAELDRRGDVLSTEGTWHAGVDGARAGVFMPARPRVGERHRQEFLRGHAEDHFQVVSLRARVVAPFGTFDRALRTREWTPLEPGVLDAKFYVRGVGQVVERTIRGGREQLALVRIVRRGSDAT